jgi:hypothetical protein
MKIDADAIEKAVARSRAVGAIIFDPEGKEVVRVGSFESIECEGLFSALFSGPEEVQRLRDSLEGQLLPQIWGQGATNCFVSKLADGTVYCVFSQTPMDARALYRASREAARDLERILGGKE